MVYNYNIVTIYKGTFTYIISVRENVFLKRTKCNQYNVWSTLKEPHCGWYLSGVYNSTRCLLLDEKLYNQTQ